MEEILNLNTLCRCCHADNNLKSLLHPHMFNGNIEIYAEMIQDIFNVKIPPPAIDASCSICEKCISKLREAKHFRDKIIACELKFLEYCQNEIANSTVVKLEPDFYEDGLPDSTCVKFEVDFERASPADNSKPLKLEHENKKDTNLIPKTEDKDVEDKCLKNELIKSKNKYDKEQKQLQIRKKVTRKSKNTADVKQCKACEKRFESEQDLKQHLNATHTGPVKCRNCLKSFRLCKNLDRHWKACKHLKSYKCEYSHSTFKALKHKKGHTIAQKCSYCPKEFSSLSMVLAHECREHTRTNKYICDTCGKEYSRASVMRRHLILHAGPEKQVPKNPNIYDVTCDLCGLKLYSKFTLKNHILAVHEKKPVGLKVACPTCGKHMPKKDLNTHLVKIHKQGQIYRCGVCQRKFITKRKHDEHLIQKHGCFVKFEHDFAQDEKAKGPREYRCRVCKKAFEDTSLFRAHMKGHSELGQLPHICEVCGKGFGSPYSLRRHIESHDAAFSDGKYSCDICGKKFASKGSEERHKKTIHDPSKAEEKKLLNKLQKLKCPICPSGYKTFDLEAHLRRHEQSKKFPCNLCYKTYISRSGLNVHLKQVHQKLRKFPCSLCHKGYNKRDQLERHKIRAHRCKLDELA